MAFRRRFGRRGRRFGRRRRRMFRRRGGIRM